MQSRMKVGYLPTEGFVRHLPRLGRDPYNRDVDRIAKERMVVKPESQRTGASLRIGAVTYLNARPLSVARRGLPPRPGSSSTCPAGLPTVLPGAGSTWRSSRRSSSFASPARGSSPTPAFRATGRSAA